MGSRQGLLVAVDFQPASLAALAKAGQIALASDLELWLLHVYAVPVFAYPGIEPVMAPTLSEEIATSARQSLDALAASCGAARRILLSGDPSTQILKVIQETRPALVALGTHGRGALAHLLLGSVAERVVRESAAPVLTVHAPREAAA